MTYLVVQRLLGFCLGILRRPRFLDRGFNTRARRVGPGRGRAELLLGLRYKAASVLELRKSAKAGKGGAYV